MSGRKWYQFGAFRFDGRLLYRGEERLELPEREARILLMLVEAPLHLVRKEDLLAVYGPRADPNNVDQAVTRLRRVLGDGSAGRPRSYRFIDTVQGDGYVWKHPLSVTHEACLESLADYYAGLEWWGSREPDAIWKAKESFEAVLHRDPTFALAHAALADCYATLGSHSWMPACASAARAKAAANKALVFDSSLAEPHATLGCIYSLFEYRWADGERELLQAIEQAPAYGTARHRYALLLAAIGQLPRALEEIARAKELDPLSRTVEVHLGTLLYFARRYDEAEQQCREALRFNRSFWYAHYQYGLVCEQQGRSEEAVAEQRLALDCFREPSALLTAALARALALAGAVDECRRLLEEVRHPNEARGSVFFHSAAAYAALGDTDAAFEALGNGAGHCESWLAFAAVDPRLDTLRGDARFPALLGRLGLTADPYPHPFRAPA
jgi:serine/threonine-protein kinase